MPSATIGSRPQRGGTDYLWERWENDLSSLNHQCMETRKKILDLFDARTIRAQSSTYRFLAASLEIHMNFVEKGPSVAGGKNSMPPSMKPDQDYIYICWQRFTDLCEQGQKLYDSHKAEQDQYPFVKRELDLMEQCMAVLRKDLASYESLLKEAKASFHRGPYPPRLFGKSPSDATKVSINRGTQTDGFDPAREDVNPDGGSGNPSSPDSELGNDEPCWRGCHTCHRWRRGRFLCPPGNGFSSSRRINRQDPSPPSPETKQPAPRNDREAQPSTSTEKAARDVRQFRPPSVIKISSGNKESPRNIELPPSVINTGSDSNSASKSSLNVPIRQPPRTTNPENVQKMPKKPETTTAHDKNPILTPPFDGDYDVFAFSECPKSVPAPSNIEKTQPKPAKDIQNISLDIPKPQQGTEKLTKKPSTSTPPKYMTAVERMLHNMGYKQGMGLGPRGTGITSPVKANGKGLKDKLTGLGYNTTDTDTDNDNDDNNDNNDHGNQTQNQSNHAPNHAPPLDVNASLNAIIQGGKSQNRNKNGGVSSTTNTNANNNPQGSKTTKKVRIQLPLPDGSSKAGSAGSAKNGKNNGSGTGKHGKGKGKNGGGGMNDNQNGGNKNNRGNNNAGNNNNRSNGNNGRNGGNSINGNNRSNNNNKSRSGSNNNNRNNNGNGNSNNRDNGNVSKHANSNYGKGHSW